MYKARENKKRRTIIVNKEPAQWNDANLNKYKYCIQITMISFKKAEIDIHVVIVIILFRTIYCYTYEIMNSFVCLFHVVCLWCLLGIIFSFLKHIFPKVQILKWCEIYQRDISCHQIIRLASIMNFCYHNLVKAIKTYTSAEFQMLMSKYFLFNVVFNDIFNIDVVVHVLMIFECFQNHEMI